MSVEPPSHLSQLSPGRRCDLVEKPLNFRDLSGALFSRHLEPFDSLSPPEDDPSFIDPACCPRLDPQVSLNGTMPDCHATGFYRAVRFFRGGRCGILGNRFRESRMVVHEQRQLNPR